MILPSVLYWQRSSKPAKLITCSWSTLSRHSDCILHVLGEMCNCLEVSCSSSPVRDVAKNSLLTLSSAGRTLNQCRDQFDTMMGMQIQHPSQTTKRKSVGDLNEPYPKRIASMTQLEYQPQSQVLSTPRAINIQPRPTNSRAPVNGIDYGYNVFHSNPSPTVSSAPGRKRGRPSKADKEAQARANATAPSQQVAYAPISPAPGPVPTPTGKSATPVNLHPTQNAYHVVPGGPGDSNSHTGRPSSDRAQPRGLAENLLERPGRTDTSEKSPSISNLLEQRNSPEPKRHVLEPPIHHSGNPSAA